MQARKVKFYRVFAPKYKNVHVYVFLLLRLAADTESHRFNFAARFSIKQYYVLPTLLYLCVLCGSENKQRLQH
jgi:hypothetical protein